mgnify:CR=1 FL=1
MTILIASLLYTGIVVAEENVQEKIKTLDSFYPEKNTSIKYQQEWQMDLYKKRIKEFKNNPIGQNKIVFLGNSITEGGGDWNARFGVKNIVNRGISGDITEGVLDRLDEIIYYKPIAVFLLIGINDIFNADIPDREKITPLYVSKNILKIADQITSQSPSTKIFIQTVLPINHEIFTEISDGFPEHDFPLPIQINKINSLLKNNDFGNIQYISSIQTQKKLMRDVYENELSQNINFNVNHYIGCHYIHQASCD